MNSARLAEIREMAEKATPGPWRVERRQDCWDAGLVEWIGPDKDHGIGPAHVHAEDAWLDCTDETANFVACARSAVPELLDEVERLTKWLDNLADRHDDPGAASDAAAALLGDPAP